MLKVRLDMGFKDALGRPFKIWLDSPREDLDKERVETTMNFILDKDIFVNKREKLTSIASAKIVKTEIKDFNVGI